MRRLHLGEESAAGGRAAPEHGGGGPPVKLCAVHNIPFIPRGAGTSLSGAVLAVTGGIMIALTRMNRVLSVDYRNRRALVEAGCVNAWITNAVKSHGLLYAPDPSSQPACTIGGNVAMNSGGPHTLKYGVTTDHVLGFEMVLPDGELVWLGAKPEGGEEVDGYDLRGAAIGSEGMFGVVTRARPAHSRAASLQNAAGHF